jgi:predicted heme/steroid binding protein
MKRINAVKLAFTWEDGKTEAMYESLPEYLHDEINTYLNELEEHRAEVGDEYVFVDDVAERVDE